MVWDSKGANSFYLSGTAIYARSGFVVSADQLANLTLKGDTSAGTQTLWIRAHDGTKWGAWDAFTLTTTNSNTAPTVTSTALTSITEDSAYSYTFAASDVDSGDTITYAATTLPSWLTFNAKTGVLSGTPDNAQVGNHSVVLTATDSGGAVDTQSFTITVSNVNDAPTVTSTALTSITEDSAYSYTFAASDVDSGDTITYAATTLPSWLTFNAKTGVLSGTPDNAQVGNHSVVLTATDSGGAVDTQSFTITVSNVNDAPTVTSTALTSITEDSAYSYTFAASDVDSGDTITYAATTLPSWLTFNAKTGVLSGTPDNAQVGNHSVVLTATDSGGAVDTQSFTITVSNVNDAPTVTSTALTSITEDSAYSYTFAASDVDSGDTITYAATTLPSWLTFNAKTGVLSGTPDNAQVGNHSVVLTATDSGGAVDTQSFTITVSNVNDAPTVTSTALTSITEGSAYSYTFAASDVDSGDTITYAATTLPSWLTFNAKTGVLSGTPDNAQVGNHSVVLTATDSGGAVDTQSFTVNVAALNTEFQVNKISTGAQYEPAISTLDDGGFVVVYTYANEYGKSPIGLLGQIYDANGNTSGSTFHIDSEDNYNFDPGSPSVAGFQDGGFCVTWWTASGSEQGIFCQRFSANGTKLGEAFKVNTSESSSHRYSEVTALENGDFVVTWQSLYQSGDPEWGIFGQRFDATGNSIGSEFHINTTTARGQSDPSIASLSTGGFIVTWGDEYKDGSGYGIFGQIYDVSGNRIENTEFQVNTQDQNHQRYSSVDELSNGNILVAWTSDAKDGGGNISGMGNGGIFGQLLNSDGTKIGSEFQINTYVTGNQVLPSTASLADGGFIVAWQSQAQDQIDGDSSRGGYYGIFGQRYDAAGNKVGTEFQINTTTNDDQQQVEVAVWGDGFVVTWESFNQDGGSVGVYAQRFNANGDPVGPSYNDNLASIDTESYSTFQEGETITFDIVLDSPSHNRVSVQLENSWQAIRSGDLTLLTETVIIEAGSTRGTARVLINDDAVFESTENMMISIISASGVSIAAGSKSQYVFSVKENDKPASGLVSIDRSSVASYQEGEKITFDIVLDSISDRDVVVQLENTWLSQRPGDITLLTETVVIAAGTTRGTATVLINNDAEAESNEIMKISIVSATGAIIDISDNDVGLNSEFIFYVSDPVNSAMPFQKNLASTKTLLGTADDTILDGGFDSDTITKGAGNDIIVLRAGDGGSTLADADTITDFTDGADVLSLYDGLHFTDLTITQGSGSNSSDTIVSIGSEYLVVLAEINVSYIGEDDFWQPDFV